MKRTQKVVRKFQVKSKKPFFHNPFVDKIPTMDEEDLENVSVTFHGYDGSTRYMECRKGFFTKRYGKRLTSGEIIQKINSYSYDFGAKYFTVQ